MLHKSAVFVTGINRKLRLMVNTVSSLRDFAYATILQWMSRLRACGAPLDRTTLCLG